jgi:predicted ATPase with chaperone activity
MCENCTKIRDRCWNEIRDLMNYNRKVNGPLSERIKAKVEELRTNDEDFMELSDEEVEARVTSMRCEMIAQRTVFIATNLPGGIFHQMSPSNCMGIMAGNLLQKEIQDNPFLGLLFGGGMFGSMQ